MEKDKYYVPSIEEFHVGFEYYMVDESSHHKVILTENMLTQVLKFRTRETCFYKFIQEEIVLDRIRVKYLNREDIESLGFICKPNTRWWQKDNIIIWWFSNMPTNIMIESIKGNKFKIDVLIKNKSELKKLLEQLNIK